MTGEQKMKQILSLPESQEEQLQMLAQSIAESLNFEGIETTPEEILEIMRKLYSGPLQQHGMAIQ